MSESESPAIDIGQLRELVRSELFTAAAGDAFETMLQELAELRAMRVAVHAATDCEGRYQEEALSEIERLTR